MFPGKFQTRKQRVLSLWKSGHSSSILGCGQDLHVERWGKKAFQERDPHQKHSRVLGLEIQVGFGLAKVRG